MEGGDLAGFLKSDENLFREIAVKKDYEELMALCKTSREFYRLCRNNYFWELKTEYDFGDLYDLEEFEGNWWDNYQYYRSLFTLELITQLKEREPFWAEILLNINDERKFLNVDGQDEVGDTALMWASAWGYTDIMRRLLDLGADFNLQNDEGDTALLRASWRAGENQEALWELLNQEGIDVNHQDNEGYTALMGVVYNFEGVEFVRRLLELGANPNLENNEGETALSLFDEELYPEIAREFRAAERIWAGMV